MQENPLGEYLKTLRRRCGYSQEFVASKLNIIRQTYSHYETGRIMPPVDSLYHLSKLYNVPVDSFFDLALSNDGSAAMQEESVTLFYGAPRSANAALTKEEKELLQYYRLLDSRDRCDILQFMKIKCSRSENK